ncbi:hypothetical protein CMUS01_09851 [Colletotrichum musicola]|uniref:Uncharacterized protein n=1 Tax=Colletotrichum musicola TaxID=2175873 RepID=A0A8H6N9J7_9PEZI|nr:hypothetical protein CMUS01_09851 [Colletotrichum musicola]
MQTSPAPKPPPEALESRESYVPRAPAVIWSAFLNVMNIENPTPNGASKTPMSVLGKSLKETFINYLTIERSQEKMFFRVDEKGRKVHIPPHDSYMPTLLNQQGSILSGHQDMTQILEESQWQHKPDEPDATLAEMRRQGFLPDVCLDTWTRVKSGGIENEFQLQPFDVTFPPGLNLLHYLHDGSPFWSVHDYIENALQVTHRTGVPIFKQALRVQLSPGRLPTVRNMQA